MMGGMRHAPFILAFAFVVAAPAEAGQTAPPAPRAQAPAPPKPAPSPPVPVTPENFPRAESDLNFAAVVKEGGLGKFVHRRDAVALDHRA